MIHLCYSSKKLLSCFIGLNIIKGIRTSTDISYISECIDNPNVFALKGYIYPTWIDYVRYDAKKSLFNTAIIGFDKPATTKYGFIHRTINITDSLHIDTLLYIENMLKDLMLILI